MKNLSLITCCLLVVVIFSSCEKPDPYYANSNDDNDIYVSNHAKDVSFANFKYYVISDSVYNVSDDVSLSGATLNASDRKVLDQIKIEMSNKGFILGVNPAPLANKNDTEIIINVSRANVTATVTGGGYNPYYGYGGYWGYPYYGYGYGYYYPSYYYSYEISGGLYYIDMFDIQNISTNHAFNNVWSGYVAGPNPTVNTSARAVNGVKTLFAQSPYLHDGK